MVPIVGLLKNLRGSKPSKNPSLYAPPNPVSDPISKPIIAPLTWRGKLLWINIARAAARTNTINNSKAIAIRWNLDVGTVRKTWTIEGIL